MDAISIIVPCYNEERHLERKVLEIIQECAHSHIRKYEIIVVSDGSSDGTNAIVAQFESIGLLRGIVLKERQGKANAINLGMSQASHAWVILSDVRQLIRKGSFQKLLGHFSNGDIGAVSSKLDHMGSSWTRQCINFLKLKESQAGSTVGVYGALYAIRKSCYVPIPVDTILDDLLISLNVLRQGKRVLFEPEAVVTDVEIERFYDRGRSLRLIIGLWLLWFGHSRMILSLPPRQLIMLAVHKYYKFFFPPLLFASVFLAFYGQGFESLTARIAGLALLGLGAVAVVFGYPRLRFAIRILLFSWEGIFLRKRHRTVLWQKLK